MKAPTIPALGQLRWGVIGWRLRNPHREFKASSVRPFLKTTTTTSSWVLAAVVHSFRPGPQTVSLRLAWST